MSGVFGREGGGVLLGDFSVDVGLGNIPGASCFDSLAERSNVDQKVEGVDVWRGTADQIPVPPSGGEQMTIVSTEAADFATGTGVQELVIEYIDAAGDQRTETIVPTGLAPKDTVATDIRFVNAIRASKVGSFGVAEGTITIYQKGDPTRVYNLVVAGGNMSLTSSRMIPAGHSFYVQGWTATSTTQNKQIALRLRATSRNGILIPGVFLFIDSAVLEVATYRRRFACAHKIPALAIIKVSGWANQVGTDVSASFDGVLIAD